MKKQLTYTAAVLLILTVVFFLGRCNGIRSVIKTTGSDTTISRDSSIVRYKPVPYKVIVRDTIPGRPVPYKVIEKVPGDPVVMIEPVDTAQILRDITSRYINLYKDHHSQYLYSDTIKTKTSSVVIKDTVSKNKITGRSVELYSSDTTIKTTTLLSQKKKAVVYFSASLTGNKSDPLAGQGAGLAIKSGNDFVYQLGVRRLNNGSVQTFFEASILIPIRLTKKRQK